MLAAMFAPGSSRAPSILTDGAFFLDRDPKVFEVQSSLKFHLLNRFQNHSLIEFFLLVICWLLLYNDGIGHKTIFIFTLLRKF